MPTCLQVTGPTEANIGNANFYGTADVSETLTYQATFDSPPTFVEACNANAGVNGRIPPLFDKRGYLYLLQYGGKQNKKKPRMWEIKVTYRLPKPHETPAPASPDPAGEKWGIEVRINTVPFDVEVQQEISGAQIKNTVGDPIAGIMVSQKMEEISIGFTTNVIDWTGLDRAFGPHGRGCTNSQPVYLTILGTERTFAVGTLLFSDYDMTYVLDWSGITYPRMTYKLMWREDGWRRMIANKGYRQLLSGVPTPILAGTGPNAPKISTPVYLKPSGSDVIQADPGDAVVIINGSDGQPGDVIYDTDDLGSFLLADLNT